MYGVPADLDLTDYVGSTCILISIGEFQIQLHFQPVATISIEGRWELRDSSGLTVDQSVSNPERDSLRLHLLLGQPVVESSIQAPISFSLNFKSGHVFEVFDDSTAFESCQLSPSGVII